MKSYLVLIIVIVFAFLQVTFVDYFNFFGAKPDLLLIAAFIGGLSLKLGWALGIGLLSGILKDSFLLNRFGLNAALFPLWVLLSKKLSRRVSIEDNLSRAILIALISLLNNIINGIFLFYAGAMVPLGIFLRIAIISSFYTALVSYFTLRIIIK